MIFRAFAALCENAAPRFLGALFYFAICFGGVISCEKKADFATVPAFSSEQEADEGTPPEKAEADLPEPSEISTTREISPVQEFSTPSTNLRFVSYNLKNWLTMERSVGDTAKELVPKPEKEKQAVVRILVEQRPDVIGVCEIGTPEDLADLQNRLQRAGLSLSYSHYTGGADPIRHLGLLSRFPLTKDEKPMGLVYQMDGKTRAMNRGILDISSRIGKRDYRFIGVHLKSKRESPSGDPEAMRLGEAKMLRRHLDSIFSSAKDLSLIVYGDFNDTKASRPIKTLTGKSRNTTSLTPLPLQDSHGEAWTHYWELNDIYSRFDFIMVSRTLRSEVNLQQSRVIDHPLWNEASDHRPILAVFR